MQYKYTKRRKSFELNLTLCLGKNGVLAEVLVDYVGIYGQASFL